MIIDIGYIPINNIHTPTHCNYTCSGVICHVTLLSQWSLCSWPDLTWWNHNFSYIQWHHKWCDRSIWCNLVLKKVEYYDQLAMWESKKNHLHWLKFNGTHVFFYYLSCGSRVALLSNCPSLSSCPPSLFCPDHIRINNHRLIGVHLPQRTAGRPHTQPQNSEREEEEKSHNSKRCSKSNTHSTTGCKEGMKWWTELSKYCLYNTYYYLWQSAYSRLL